MKLSYNPWKDFQGPVFGVNPRAFVIINPCDFIMVDKYATLTSYLSLIYTRNEYLQKLPLPTNVKLYDEDLIPIPKHVIDIGFSKLFSIYKKQKNRKRYNSIRSKRRWRGYRKVKVGSERIENSKSYCIDISYRKRYIPICSDDFLHSDVQRSWKKYRKKQYKEITK